MKLPDNLTKMLLEPLPPQSIKPHPTKPYLSSINAIYVTERLNQVFGIGGWKYKIEVIDQTGKMVTVKATFTVEEYGIELEQFGGNDNADKGDALKGAATDALTKIGSYLGIGQDVWKNTKPVEIKTEKPYFKPDGTATAYKGRWFNGSESDYFKQCFNDGEEPDFIVQKIDEVLEKKKNQYKK